MKKVISVLAIFVLISCGVKKAGSSNAALYEVLTTQSDGGGNIKFFEILTEPNEIKILENDPLLAHKMKDPDIQDYNYVILNMGEKNTSGYSIDVEKVEETDKNIIITIKEISQNAYNGKDIEKVAINLNPTDTLTIKFVSNNL